MAGCSTMNRLILLLPAALLLTAACAVAQPTDKPPPAEPNRQVLQVPLPSAKPPPAVMTAADIPGPACTPEHRALIDDALAEARTRIAGAIRLVREQPDNPHITRWFGDSPRKTIGMALELTRARLMDSDALEIRCNDPTGCPGGRFAYARDLILGLCPPYFRARMDGTDSRWGILIHEASHIAANTRDHAYRPNGALALAKQDSARAAANADNYEYFIETLGR